MGTISSGIGEQLVIAIQGFLIGEVGYRLISQVEP